MVKVPVDRLACKGGPLHYLDVSEPWPTKVPCSDGAYVLSHGYDSEDSHSRGGWFYAYEPEGRIPVGTRSDDH